MIYVWAVEHVNGGFKMGLSAYHTHNTERKMKNLSKGSNIRGAAAANLNMTAEAYK